MLEQVIERLRRSPAPCYLAVLKDFGPAGGPPLSFPIAGWTLALDLPAARPALTTLLDGFDELVADSGRARLPEQGRADEARGARPRCTRDSTSGERSATPPTPSGLWRSDLGVRVGLVEEMIAVPEHAPADSPRVTPFGGPPRNVLMIGGSSEIAVGIVRRLAADGPVRPYLLGRDRVRLEAAALELQPRRRDAGRHRHGRCR